MRSRLLYVSIWAAFAALAVLSLSGAGRWLVFG